MYNIDKVVFQRFAVVEGLGLAGLTTGQTDLVVLSGRSTACCRCQILTLRIDNILRMLTGFIQIFTTVITEAIAICIVMAGTGNDRTNFQKLATVQTVLITGITIGTTCA